MKRIKVFIVIMALMALLLAACGKSGTNEHMDHSGGHQAGMEQADNINAVFSLAPEKTQPKQDAMVTIQIQDKDGKPIEEFDIKHEKKMHLIVVSKDLSFFNHIHPEEKGDGQFAVTTQFPAAGEYELISDFAPTGMEAMTRKQWITVEGDAPAPQPIEPDANLTTIVDGKEVSLTVEPLESNKEAHLTFTIKDAATGNPIDDLQPYLGAVGHVVILDDTAEQYLHVHPMDERSSGPDAMFMATFPHSGTYKIWGQFQREDKVFTVPFVVKVS